jgi:hypothetical protein
VTTPSTPRYSPEAFPPYAYRPGTTPHPRRDPEGHSRELPEPSLDAWQPDQWRSNQAWLRAVDLYNHGFWWEAHELLEALWQAAGRDSPHAVFVQGFLQVGAAFLNREQARSSARLQAEKGLARMAVILIEAPNYMGIDVVQFNAAVRASFSIGAAAPTLRLAEPQVLA